jgi:hypothetical protein
VTVDQTEIGDVDVDAEFTNIEDNFIVADNEVEVEEDSAVVVQD